MTEGLCDNCTNRREITNPEMWHYALYCVAKRAFLSHPQKTCVYFQEAKK